MSAKQNPPRFLGTYFDSAAVFRIVGGARIAAWLILAVYVLEFAASVGIYTLQVLRGFFVGLGPTDYAQQMIYFLKLPLSGILFFFVLQAAAQALLILLDIESNTRRAGQGK